ncbi:MAG: TlpA disulfide reductase family protein [Cocleimonas sp.]
MKKAILLVLVTVIGLGVAYGARKYYKYYTPDTSKAGQLVEDFTLPLLSGGEKKLSDYKGNLILLNFWASWCPPCREEIPDFIKVQNKYKDKKFTILGISIEDKEPTQTYAKKVGINFPILYGEEKGIEIGKKYGLIGVPYSMLLDQDQKIIAIYPSYQTLDESRLTNDIDKYLK